MATRNMQLTRPGQGDTRYNLSTIEQYETDRVRIKLVRLHNTSQRPVVTVYINSHCIDTTVAELRELAAGDCDHMSVMNDENINNFILRRTQGGIEFKYCTYLDYERDREGLKIPTTVDAVKKLADSLEHHLHNLDKRAGRNKAREQSHIMVEAGHYRSVKRYRTCVTAIEQVADDAAVLTRDDGQLAKLTDVTGERATVTLSSGKVGNLSLIDYELYQDKGALAANHPYEVGTYDCLNDRIFSGGTPVDAWAKAR